MTLPDVEQEELRCWTHDVVAKARRTCGHRHAAWEAPSFLGHEARDRDEPIH